MGLLDTKRRREVPAIEMSEVYDASVKDLPEPRTSGGGPTNRSSSGRTFGTSAGFPTWAVLNSSPMR